MHAYLVRLRGVDVDQDLLVERSLLLQFRLALLAENRLLARVQDIELAADRLVLLNDELGVRGVGFDLLPELGGLESGRLVALLRERGEGGAASERGDVRLIR